MLQLFLQTRELAAKEGNPHVLDRLFPVKDPASTKHIKGDFMERMGYMADNYLRIRLAMREVMDLVLAEGADRIFPSGIDQTSTDGPDETLMTLTRRLL